MEDAGACCHPHTVMSMASQENTGREKEREAGVKGKKRELKEGKEMRGKKKRPVKKGGRCYNSVRKVYIL